MATKQCPVSMTTPVLQGSLSGDTHLQPSEMCGKIALIIISKYSEIKYIAGSLLSKFMGCQQCNYWFFKNATAITLVAKKPINCNQ